MGYLRTYAFVCLACKKSFKRNCNTSEYIEELICPDCGKTTYNYGRNFHVPKINDEQQWKKIQFLFKNGFRFQRIYDTSKNYNQIIQYPKTLNEAKDFVIKYKLQSLN